MRTTSQRSTVVCQALCLHFSYEPHHKRTRVGIITLIHKGKNGHREVTCQRPPSWQVAVRTPNSNTSGPKVHLHGRHPRLRRENPFMELKLIPCFRDSSFIDLSQIRSAVLLCKRTETGQIFTIPCRESCKLAQQQNQLHAGMRTQLL